MFVRMYPGCPPFVSRVVPAKKQEKNRPITPVKNHDQGSYATPREKASVSLGEADAVGGLLRLGRSGPHPRPRRCRPLGVPGLLGLLGGERVDLLAGLLQAAAVLLLELGADLVQRQEGRGAVDVGVQALSGFALVSKAAC